MRSVLEVHVNPHFEDPTESIRSNKQKMVLSHTFYSFNPA